MDHPTSGPARPEAGSSLPPDVLGAFSADLHAAGLCAEHIRRLLCGARHFLVWLDLGGIAVGSVDDAVLRAFHRHDCQCPGMDGTRWRAPAPRRTSVPDGCVEAGPVPRGPRRHCPSRRAWGQPAPSGCLSRPLRGTGLQTGRDPQLWGQLPPLPDLAASVAHPAPGSRCRYAGTLPAARLRLSRNAPEQALARRPPGVPGPILPASPRLDRRRARPEHDARADRGSGDGAVRGVAPASPRHGRGIGPPAFPSGGHAGRRPGRGSRPIRRGGDPGGPSAPL